MGALAALALFGNLVISDAATGEPVAVELLLAVDASVSVNPTEFDLQVGGIARAFRSEAVTRAIRAVGAEGIAVAVYHWGNVEQQRLVVDWMRVRDSRGARALAARIAAAPRAFLGGATAIHSALDYAIPRFDQNDFEGRHRVLDVSADGRNNCGTSPERARDRAVARGITINGLAILNDVLFLDDYFHRRVIGGAAAFVEPAEDYDDFARAIEAKLVREITGQPGY